MSGRLDGVSLGNLGSHVLHQLLCALGVVGSDGLKL